MDRNAISTTWKYGLIIIFLGWLLKPFATRAQGENNFWYFGKHYGINFNQNPPQLFESNIYTLEGCSSVSDAGGNLLFYTMGSRIWDRNGNEMPNSTGLLGNGPVSNVTGLPAGSSYSGVAIIRNPANHNQYYIFSGETDILTRNLYYSLIDMTLNGGLGDVVPTVKNKVLMTDVTELICPAPGPDCRSSWLIARQLNTNDYFAFKVDAGGVHDIPVVTPVTPGSEAHFMVSPDGNTIVSTGSNLMVAKFNKNTGVLYDQVTTGVFLIGPPDFSPDGTKVYVGYLHLTDVGVKQLDLSLLPNIAAFQSAVTELDPFATLAERRYTYTRLGPDGKMYLLRSIPAPLNWTVEICRIDFPNVAGAACGFTPNIFGVPSWALTNDPFGSFPRTVFINKPDTVYRTVDSFLCPGATITLSSWADNGNYLWNTGTGTRSITVADTGKYWVRNTDACGMWVDSFNVLPIGKDVALSQDTLVCSGTAVTLSVRGAANSAILWSTGAVTHEIIVDQPGKYYVSVTNQCGALKDSVTVSVQDCRCIPFIPNVFSPNGDLLNDGFGVKLECPGLLDFEFSIYSRFGQRVYHSKDPFGQWDGMFNQQPSDVGVYFYYLVLHKSDGHTTSFKGDLTLLR